MHTAKNLLRKMSFFQLGFFLLLLKCTNAAVVDSFPTKEAATNKNIADDEILTGVKLASPQPSASKIESIKNSGFVDIFEAEEDNKWGEDELVWGSEEFLNQQNTIKTDETDASGDLGKTSDQKNPRQLLSTRKKGRRLHLRGGVCMTASSAYPQVGGRCDEGAKACRSALDAAQGTHGDFAGSGSCYNIPGRTCRNNPIDTSAVYVAGRGDFPNFFTCSYHFQLGNRKFDGCMSGRGQSTQLTFAITYHDDGSFQPRNTHGQGDQIEVQWNRCSSTTDCLNRWPYAGLGSNGQNQNNINNRAYGYSHQMGWSNANDRSTQSCWGKYKGTGSMAYGRIGGCNYWHHSDFANAPINKGSASTMNNAGASGRHDSLMMNPRRQPTNYWSSSGKSGAIAGSGSGGLNIDMLHRDYGPGWYTATIGGFGCEIDTDTTWFRIKGGGCNPGTKCPGGTSSGICTAKCATCVAGRYSSTKNAASCTYCLAGKKGTSVGQTSASSCTNCPAGTGSAAGSTSCTTCAAGRFAASGAQCANCPRGFMAAAGSSACTNCPAGYDCPGSTNSPIGSAGGPVLCGGATKYCPEGNKDGPKNVEAGYYGVSPAVPGTLTSFKSQAECKIGHTCDNGLLSLTIPGRFSGKGKSASQVTNCQTGTFCDYGSISSTGLTVHNQRVVITAFSHHGSTNGMFTHDEWPRGVEIKGGKKITLFGFSSKSSTIDKLQFTVLTSPAPTRTTFHVDFNEHGSVSRPSAFSNCALCYGVHNDCYKAACMHYRLDGKADTNEWTESAENNKCAGTAYGTPRYGIGHESPQACKVTCNSVSACVGFTWHKGATSVSSQMWNGGCEYFCNADTSTGICKTGSGKGTVSTGKQCTTTTTTAAGGKTCYSKPCYKDTIPPKDCSWFCEGMGKWGIKHVSAGKNGCSYYTSQTDCERTGTGDDRENQCVWLMSPSNSAGNRCTDRHDKPMRVRGSLFYTSPLAPLSTCSTRQDKTPCPNDKLCTAGSIGDRLEFTTTKVRVTEVTVTNGGKRAVIGRELLRGSAQPVFVATDKVNVAGFGNDLDGRWEVDTTPPAGDYTSNVVLKRTKVASIPTIGTTILCPSTGPGCEMRLVDDRGQIPICSDASSNSARSARFIRESTQAITAYEDGLIMNVRDYKCNVLGVCGWDTSTNPPGYPAGKDGMVLPKGRITIKKQVCAPSYGQDRKDYNNGNDLFVVYDNIPRDASGNPVNSGNKNSWRNWIGTSDFTLATLHGDFTAPNPQTSQSPQRGIHTYCTKWNLDIEVVGFAEGAIKQECSLTVDVVNENDPPQFRDTQLVTRSFPEKCAPGTVVTNDASGNPIGGLSSDDSDAPGGKGQNNFFHLRQVNYPTVPGCPGGCKSAAMNANQATCQTAGCGCIWDASETNTAKKCDWTGDYDWSDAFTVSECDGNIIVNKAVRRSYHNEVWLCVDVCDDAGYFPPDVGGTATVQQLCTPSTTSNPTECPAAYSNGGVGGQLIKLELQDLNDAPYFVASTICTATNPCSVRENAIAGEAVYWPGKLACQGGGTSCSKPGTPPPSGFFGTLACDGLASEGNCAVADMDMIVKEPDDNAVKYFLTQQASDKPSANLFEIDNKGVIRVVAGAVLDFENIANNGQSNYLVTVKVIDQVDAISSCPDNYDLKEKSCYAEKVLAIKIIDGNDKPFWSSTVGTNAEVSEGATYNTLLTGIAPNPYKSNFMATDEDTSDALTYSTTSTKFEVLEDPGSKSLTLKIACPNNPSKSNCPTQLDYETATSHTVKITVTDNKGASADLDITVNVLDENEKLQLGNNVDGVTATSKTFVLKNSTRCTGASVGDIISDGVLSAAIRSIKKDVYDSVAKDRYDACEMYGDVLPARSVTEFTLTSAVNIIEDQGVAVKLDRASGIATGLLTFALPVLAGQKTDKITVTSPVDQSFDISSNLLLNGGSTTITPANLKAVKTRTEVVADVVDAPLLLLTPSTAGDTVTYKIAVPEDSPIGFVVARKSDFLITDVDVPAVNHKFVLTNDQAKMDAIKPGNVASNALVIGNIYTINDAVPVGGVNWIGVGAVNKNHGTTFTATGTSAGAGGTATSYTIVYEPSQFYKIDTLTGDITVDKTLDSDGTPKRGSQTLRLEVTEPDGSLGVLALIEFKLQDVDEPPLAVDLTQFYCVEEMVGSMFDRCADISDASQYSSDTKTNAQCPRISSKPTGGCQSISAVGLPSTFDVIDPEDHHISFKGYRPSFVVVENDPTTMNGAKVGNGFGQLEWSPGVMLDYEDANVGGTYKVRINFGDPAHPLENYFVASIEIIDRNDSPRWGINMPMLMGWDQATPLTVSYDWRYKSPDYTGATVAQTYTLNHNDVSKTTQMKRYETGPMNVPKHLYCPSTADTCIQNKMDGGIADLHETKRLGMIVGKVAGVDDDCQNTAAGPCAVTDNNELHYMLSTKKPDGTTAVSETNAGKKDTTAKKIWPKVYACTDTRKTSEDTECNPGTANCWAYSKPSECANNPCKPTMVASNALVVGTVYTINDAAPIDGVNWIGVGAVNNNFGTTFTATGTSAGSSAGTAALGATATPADAAACTTCKANTAYCKSWSTTPIANFYPFVIDEMTGVVRVNMFCAQSADNKHNSPNDHDKSQCSGSVPSLVNANSMFRVPIRIEDRGAGRPLAVTTIVATSATSATISHTAGTRPFVQGETVTVTCSGNCDAYLTTTRSFVVATVTSGSLVVTGTGMATGTYPTSTKTGTITVSPPPSACSSTSHSPEKNCNLWAEGYFDVLVTPDNRAPNAPRMVELNSNADLQTYGYPHGTVEPWWEVKSGATKAKYIHKATQPLFVDIEEYDALYDHGSKAGVWTTEVAIEDLEGHSPLTCKLDSVTPTCASHTATGSAAGATCSDMQNHFTVVANNTDPASIKCIFTLVTAIDYENELITHASNSDNSITVVFVLVDAKGRESKKMGLKLLVKNVNEAPKIALAPVDVFEKDTGELTTTATRFSATVTDEDADDAQSSITFEILEAYYSKEDAIASTERESLMDHFTLDTTGALTLNTNKPFNYAHACAVCDGTTAAVVFVKVAAKDNGLDQSNKAIPQKTSAGPNGESSLKIRINVLNINERPTIGALVVTIPEDTPTSSVINYFKIVDPDGDLATSGTFTVVQVKDEFNNDVPNLFQIDENTNSERMCNGGWHRKLMAFYQGNDPSEADLHCKYKPEWCRENVDKLKLFNGLGRNITGQTTQNECTDNCLIRNIPYQASKATWSNVMTELNENKGKELTFFHGLFREYELQDQLTRTFVKRDSTLRPEELDVQDKDFYIDPSMWKPLMELCPDCPSYVCTGSDCVWRELNFTKTGDTELAEGSIMISRRNNYNKQLNEFLSSGDEGSKTCEQLESQIVLKEDNTFNLSPDGFVLDYEDVKQYVIDIKFSDGGAAFTPKTVGDGGDGYQTFEVDFQITVNVGNVDDLEFDLSENHVIPDFVNAKTQGGEKVVIKGKNFGWTERQLYGGVSTNEWTITLTTATDITGNMNAAVTQTRAGSDASEGTLKTALNGAGETTIVIESEAGVVFSASSDLDIAGTIVPHSVLDTATNQRQHQVRGGAFGPEPTAPTITLLYGVDTSNSKTCVAAGTCFKAKNCAFVRNGLLGNGQLECETAPGKGGNHGWRLELDYGNNIIHTTSVSSDKTAYNKPFIHSLNQSAHMPTLSNTEIKIYGEDFGPSGLLVTSAVVQQRAEFHWNLGPEYAADATPIFNCNTTTAHTEITCTVKEGTGDVLEWRVIVGGQSSTTWAAKNSLQSSFAPPEITRIEGYQGTDMQELRTTGEELVHIFGKNFGPRHAFRRITYTAGVQVVNGATIIAKTYKCTYCGNDCRISDPDKVHEEIICQTEAGIGKYLQFKVEVGPALVDSYLGVEGGIKASQISPVFEKTFTYGPPTITSLEGMSRVSTRGGSIFSVRGSGFGPATPCSACTSGPCGNIPKIFEPTVYYGDAENPKKVFS
jgi:hypothetical protein